jgi:nucleotide-binding universal stress UspA family protein
VDFSDHSRRALKYAAALQAHFGGRLVIIHVVDPLLAAAQRTYQTDPLGADVHEELRAFVASAGIDAAPGSPSVELVLTMGDAAAEILKLASERRADAIVMGTHGLSGLRRVFFGSTTANVLKHANVPVIAVPLAEDAPSRADLLRQHTVVLSPVDFHESANLAARLGGELAQSLKLRLILLHVVPPLRASGSRQQAADEYNRDRVRQAQEQLQDLAASLGMSNIEVITALGDVAEEIARVAEERDAGFIVMGLHGESMPIVGHAPGSVAYRTLLQTSVPVVAVPVRRSENTGRV